MTFDDVPKVLESVLLEIKRLRAETGERGSANERPMPPGLEEPAFIDVPAAARRLSVGKSTVYRLIAGGQLQWYQVPGTDIRRLKTSEVDALPVPERGVGDSYEAKAAATLARINRKR